MKIRGIAVTLVLAFSICLSFDAVSDSDDKTADMKDGNAVAIASEIPFAKDNHIAENIKKDCDLPSKLSGFIKSYAEEYGTTIEQKPSVSESDSGRVLVVEITDSISRGNAFIGHRKYTEIAGKLYQDGKVVGTFAASRNSGGGAFAGFKNSCAVLGRTVKALGKDVGRWLKSPKMDAKLGDKR
jgi:hypothetical protein